jgi:hypothetical protein
MELGEGGPDGKSGGTEAARREVASKGKAGSHRSTAVATRAPGFFPYPPAPPASRGRGTRRLAAAEESDVAAVNRAKPATPHTAHLGE